MFSFVLLIFSLRMKLRSSCLELRRLVTTWDMIILRWTMNIPFLMGVDPSLVGLWNFDMSPDLNKISKLIIKILNYPFFKMKKQSSEKYYNIWWFWWILFLNVWFSNDLVAFQLSGSLIFCGFGTYFTSKVFKSSFKDFWCFRFEKGFRLRSIFVFEQEKYHQRIFFYN